MNNSQNTPFEGADPDRWVDDYGDYLFRYAVSRLRDTNAAEEVVQDTFLAGIRFQESTAEKVPNVPGYWEF